MKNKLFMPFILCILTFSSCGKSGSIENSYLAETLVIARSEESHDHIESVIEKFKSESTYNIIEKRYQSTDLLTIAIIGGEQIDIIYADKNIDVSPLAGKGILTDLTQYINEDEYVRSVLNAMKQNGKLYEIPYDFDVESAASKTKLWNHDTDTSFEHILDKSNELGCKIPFDYTVDSYGFITFLMSKYMDFENKTCSFDSEDFKSLIEFMKEYYRSVEGMTNEQLYESFKNDDMLMIATGFSSFDQLDYLEYDVGDEIEFIGFPSEEENFHIAVPRSTFSVADSSQNKNEAIEFVTKCISFDSYVVTLPDGSKMISHNYSLPINSEALDFCYSQSLARNNFNIPDEIRKGNADELMHQINTISYAARTSDSKIQEIIKDELSAYFAGNKDSESVCHNIQSRCMLFFDEQYN